MGRVFPALKRRATVGASLRDASGEVLVWEANTGSQVRGLAPGEAKSLHEAWLSAQGPHEPTRLPGLGAVILEGEAEWRTAWRDPERDENGLPKRVARILDPATQMAGRRWERDIGMRVNLDTGEMERLPTPGSAYANDPEIAPRCK